MINYNTITIFEINEWSLYLEAALIKDKTIYKL